MNTSKNTSPGSLNKAFFDEAIRIIRNPPPRTEGGISVKNRVKCFCGNYEESSKMWSINDTGVVRNVVSTVCKSCPNKALEAISKHYAIVCVGCKEVVIIGEPYTEKASGFKWVAGKCYHVPNCPSCLGRVIESSPVLEQKIFYKEKGIPYKDDGVL